MKRVALTVDEVELHALDQMSSTKTGSHHHLTAASEGLRWRVRGAVVEYMEGQQRNRPVNDHDKSRCSRCKQRKVRKGGTNVSHRFVCAECSE